MLLKKRLRELHENLKEIEKLRNTVNKTFLEFQSYLPRIKDVKTRIDEENTAKEKLEIEFEERQSHEKTLLTKLEAIRQEIALFDLSKLESTRKIHEAATERYHTIKTKLEFSEDRKKEANRRIETFRERLESTQQKMERVKKIERLLETVDGIRDAYRSIQPKLRTEFVRILERMVHGAQPRPSFSES